jgi:ubiquinone/menaquinone biosynthesis C-methylase UbiE
VLNGINSSALKMLHFAPEPFFREFFSKRFGQYETADLNTHGVDHNVDLQKLPFGDQTYDFVFASHVLEHVPNDEKAISEIRRILKPNGIAVLPVPLVAEKTIEYSEPNPNESYHVRAPGFDYFDRYERYFSKVDKISSDMLPSRYQLFVYENRSQWPTKECPLRPFMQGEKHIDIVPVCYVL